MKRAFRFLTHAIATAITVIAVACTPVEDKIYDREGISFSHPGNWSVTDEEFGDAYTYIAVEKDGGNSSGLVTIIRMDASLGLSPDDMLDSNREELESNFSDISFLAVADSSYGGYPARKLTYTASVGGMAHTGTVYCFTTGSRLACVGIQEADEDHSANAAGFELIEKSLTIK